MAQKRTIQFYRNANNYASRQAALNAFTGSTGVAADTSLADGEPVIARYVSDGKQYTILGINHKIGDKNNFEIFEGKSVTEADRDNKIQEKINGLIDATVTKDKVKSDDKTINISTAANGTNIEVNIDNSTLSKTGEGVIYVNRIDCGTY